MSTAEHPSTSATTPSAPAEQPPTHDPKRGVGATPAVGPAIALGGLLAFLVGCDSMVVAPIAPRMLAAWHQDARLASLLVAGYSLAYAVASPFLGALADHRGRRGVAVSGSLALALGTAATALAPNLWWGLAARALAGVGAGMVMPTVFGEVVARSDAASRGRNIGNVMGQLLASTVVGVPLGALLSAHLGWRWVFVALALPAGIAAIPAARVFAGTPAGRVQGPVVPAVLAMVRTALSRRRLLLALASTLLWNAALAMVFAAIGTFYAQAYGFDEAATGLVMLAAGAASMVGAMGGGRLVTRVGTVRYLAGCAVLAALGCVTTVASPPHLAVTVVAHVLWSLAVGAGQPALTALVATLEPRLQGTALALNGSTQYLGQFLAAALGALVLSSTGSFLALGLGSAALALLTAATVWAAAREGR